MEEGQFEVEYADEKVLAITKYTGTAYCDSVA